MCHFSEIACILMVSSTLISATPVRTCSFHNIMGDCEGMTGRFLTYHRAPEISSLFIYDSDLTHLTDSDFTQFQNLEKLTIDNCTFSNVKQYTFLADLKYLERLVITNSDITGEFIFTNGTDIRELSLQSNKLSRLSSDFFTHLKKVESVDLSDNYISDIAPDTFRNLTFLKKVNLANNSIGEGFDPLSLSLSPFVCSLCGEGRRERCMEGCRGNAEVDVLWRSLDGLEVNLKGNPACGKVMHDPVPLLGLSDEVVMKSDEEWYETCQLLKAGRCPRHAKRHEFLRLSCVPEAHRTQTTVRLDGDDAVLFPTTTGVPQLEEKIAETGDVLDAGTMVKTIGIGAFLFGVVMTLLVEWAVPVLRVRVFCAKRTDATQSRDEHQQMMPHGDNEGKGGLNTKV